MHTFSFRCHMGDPEVTHVVLVQADSALQAWEMLDANRRDGEVVVQYQSFAIKSLLAT